MNLEEYDTLTPAEQDQHAGGTWYNGPTLPDGSPDLESDAWNAYASRTWWEMVEQLDPGPAPRWIYDVDLDTRRGLIVWALIVAIVWGGCLLAYAGALWLAGALQ